MCASYADCVVPQLPKDCEEFIEKVHGPRWRIASNNDPEEINGILGLAICKAVLKTGKADIGSVSSYLRLQPNDISLPYERLTRNGYMKEGKMQKDEELRNGELIALCYIAGIASGSTGLGS